MKIYIYKITNIINGKIYIGKSNNKRFKYYYGSGIKIKKAINKYSKENFKKEILFEAKNNIQADLIEKYYIKKFNSQNKNIGYNIANGGEGINKHSKETILKFIKRGKLSIGYKNNFYGKHHSIETGKIISENNRNRIMSEETKKKISESMKGIKRSEETKRKMSLANIGDKNPMFGKRKNLLIKESIV